jgi:hypothetical protein
MPRTTGSTRKSKTARSRAGAARGRSTASRTAPRAKGRSAGSSSRGSTHRASSHSSRGASRAPTSRSEYEPGGVSTTNITTDHDFIRTWAEVRGAQPARVRGTGVLRLDFPGYSGAESLGPITWEEWFEKFDERDLAFLYQETTARGEASNFNQLVSHSGIEGRSAPARARASSRNRSESAERVAHGRGAEAPERAGALRAPAPIEIVEIEESAIEEARGNGDRSRE